ncbi:MAG: SGNH/GDSL hydrolase family protein [Sulfuritalea sp.]|nr:SGNH/GDSL hydrolase family protein [Sulfuritalea sp.]
MSLRHAFSTVALAPVLLLQGRHVRRSVALLPEPAGARAGAGGSGPLLRLLVAGDSAAAGVGAQTQEDALSGRLVAGLTASFHVEWKLLAFTGATTADLLARLEQLPAEDFDVVVTSLGVNDVTGRRSLGDWRRQQGQLIALLENKFRARHILLSGLPPMHRFPALPQPLRWYIGSRAKDFDRALASLAGSRARCEFVKLGYAMMEPQAMAADGFHPGPAIYDSWAMELVRRIVARMPQILSEQTP